MKLLGLQLRPALEILLLEKNVFFLRIYWDLEKTKRNWAKVDMHRVFEYLTIT